MQEILRHSVKLFVCPCNVRSMAIEAMSGVCLTFGRASRSGTQATLHAAPTLSMRRLMVEGWLRGMPRHRYRSPT